MSIESGDLRAAVDRTQSIISVRRVERDTASHEFEQKDPDNDRKRKHQQSTPVLTDDLPHDIVEMSDIVKATVHSCVDVGLSVSTPVASPEHHLNIKA